MLVAKNVIFNWQEEHCHFFDIGAQQQQNMFLSHLEGKKKTEITVCMCVAYVVKKTFSFFN